MSNEDKYKIALFMIIRNSKVMPAGMKLGKTEEEINAMSYETMQVILNSTIDFEKAKKIYKQGKETFERRK